MGQIWPFNENFFEGFGKKFYDVQYIWSVRNKTYLFLPKLNDSLTSA